MASTTITQISNIFNLMVQAETRLLFYHFGWRSDINKEIDNNFDVGIQTGRLYPSLQFDPPDWFQATDEPNYLGVNEDVKVLLYFDNLQDYNNDSSEETDNLIEQWEELKTIAEDFMANLAVVLQHYGVGYLKTQPKYVQKSNLHNDRLITWEVEVTVSHISQCTAVNFQIDTDLLPGTIPSADIENDTVNIIDKCALILASMDAATRCCVLKGYDFGPATNIDFNCLSGTQTTDLTTRLCAAPIFANSYSFLFDGLNDSQMQVHNAAYDFDRLDPWTFTFRIKFTSISTQSIIEKGGASGTGTGYNILLVAPGKIRIIFRAGSVANDYIAEGDFIFIVGTAYHVTIKSNGNGSTSGITMKIDDVATTITSIRDNLTGSTLNTNPLEIGMGSGYLSATMNVLRGWNIEHSTAQDTADYNGGTPTFPQVANQVVGNDMGDGALFGTNWLMPDTTGIVNSTASLNALVGARVAAI